MDDDAAVLREHYRRMYAQQMGTEAGSVKFHDELTLEQKKIVTAIYGHYKPENHAYHVRVSGDLWQVRSRCLRTRADRENGRAHRLDES